MLSPIERVLYLKEVSFFQRMTIDQLGVLASGCEEELFPAGSSIVRQGDPGGVLYVIVSGKVIEEQEQRRGVVTTVATLSSGASFGEISMFTNRTRHTSVRALQDTLVLKLRREPVLALTRQYPDLSLAFINALSQQLRDLNDQLVQATRTRPRELHKLFDQFD